MHEKLKVSRRAFLASTGAVLAFPTIIPASALGGENRPAPSSRITIGAIGCGSMGFSNIQSFFKQADCQVVAACDVDKNHLTRTVNAINKNYQNEDCKSYHDFRELLARTDIDAVMIATPDHWHAIA